MHNQVKIMAMKDQDFPFLLQLDLKVMMTDPKRHNILANLIMKNALDLTSAIVSATNDEIEETYNRLNPVRQTEIPIQEAEVVDLHKSLTEGEKQNEPGIKPENE